jgi:serine/threonine protein kinase
MSLFVPTRLHQQRSARNYLSICNIARDMGEALAHLHDRGVIHGAVCPSNILKGSDGRFRLCDLTHATQVTPPNM